MSRKGDGSRVEKIREALQHYGEDCDGLLTADGLDAAVIGIARRCGQPDIVVYSIPKAVECLVEQGMSHEDADEFLEFNSIGAWVGEQTPAWMIPIEDLVEMSPDDDTATEGEDDDDE
jgi:hypothetical protein